MTKDSLKPRNRYLIIGLGLFLGLILSLILSFNYWLKIAVEKVLSSTLGVPTQIARLSFNPLAGSLEIERLIVENPGGFSSPFLLGIQSFDLQLLPSSLFLPTIEIQSFNLDHLEIYIEQGFSLNLTPVLNHLKENAKNAKSPENRTAPETKFKASRISIEQVEFHAKLPFWERSLKLPNVNLEDLQTNDGQGLPLSEIFSQIISKVIAPVLRDNLLEIPKALLEALRRSFATSVANI